MTLVSIAIVGKDNEPLYMRDFTIDDGKSTTNTVSENQPVNVIDNIDGDDDGDDDDAEMTSPSPSPDPFGFFIMDNRPHESSSLRHQFIIHAALDRFEEITSPTSGQNWRTPGSTGSDAMWVGLLCPMEEFRVYGYLTNTNIKIMAILEDADIGKQANFSESELKSLFASVHDLYVGYTLNPFSKIKSKIISPRFDERVCQNVNEFNKSDNSNVNWI